MIGLDTNVLVRYITQDDAAQAKLANRLIDSFSSEKPGFISVVTVIELVWVLSGCYEFSKPQVIETIDLLLQSQELVLDRAAEILRALRMFRQGTADFADCLVYGIGSASGCAETLTFDIKSAKHSGMTLLR
jgi:predicted nucleic-acid-binding protein